MKPDFDLILTNCRAYNGDGAEISDVCQKAMAMCYEAVQAAYAEVARNRAALSLIFSYS